MSKPTKRQLLAIMFTDIVGYTALMQQDEALAYKMRQRHREVFEQYHKSCNGKIIQYYGDGTLSVFKSAIEAVECALAIQKTLQSGDVIPIRIGLHLGDITYNETEVFGDGVNLTSRIEQMGSPGSILLSSKLNDELLNHKHIKSISMGFFALKNITAPIEIFAIKNDNIKVPSPNELKGHKQQNNKTIAVLPFANFSDAEQEYFSDGITEEIINALAKIKELKVTSRTSSFHFKNKNLPIQQIGEALNVAIILEGSIRLAGNKVRITAQLIDVKDDFHFWSETFDREMDNIFEVQDEISLLIADKLREHIGHFNIDDHLVKAPEVPVNIYKKYLKGRFHLMKLTVDETLKGIEIFKEVIAEQPNFPLPYLDINQGYAYLGTMGLIPASEGFMKAQPFLTKALELNSELPQSQLNLSWIACWQNWDLKSAYQHAQNALNKKPSDDIYLTIANFLTVEGKLEAAHQYINKALQLDPISAMNLHYKGFLFYLEEKYQQASIYLQRGLELKPDLPFPPHYIGAIFILNGEAEKGLEYYSQLKETPATLTQLGGCTMAHAALKNIEKTNLGISKLEANLQTDSAGNALNYLVYTKTILGDYEAAIDLVEFGINNRFPMVLLYYTEPLLKPLRDFPRFQNLLKNAIGTVENKIKQKRKYKKSLFDDQTLSQYKQELLNLMELEKPYLDANLTLRSLATQLNLAPNYLSELLNEGFQKNFAEFTNEYRVEAFKKRALNPKLQHLTLLAIAYECGFNSKTVFNTFFKKSTGQTPKQFVQSQK